jgi:NADH:ubiquinone oxidoreductase subunit E
MKITICVGSTCHLLGSKRVVDRFKELVEENNLTDKIELAGKFCMGKCGEGVSVMVDDALFSVKPEEVDEFFKKEILPKA